MKEEIIKKPTVIIGVSVRPERYAYQAVIRLLAAGHPVYPVGIGEGSVQDIPIRKEIPTNTEIDTVTLYIRPERQKDYYEDVVTLHPKRVIFNPGTENPKWVAMLKKHQIEAVERCTLVMLSTGTY